MAAQPTSRYDSSISVKQDVIDRIKNMGMGKAVAAANSGGESKEFVEGAKRFYGNKVGASNAANTAKAAQTTSTSGRAASSVGDKSAPSTAGKSIPMPKSAPAAATRAVTASSPGDKKIDTAVAGGIPKAIGKWFTSGNAKAAQEEKARSAARDAAKPAPKPVSPAAANSARVSKLKGNISSYDAQSASGKRTQQYQSDIAELKKLTGK